jgi:hypothetical protein
MGGVRRVPRESFGLVWVGGVSSQTQTLVSNWTIQKTTTYNSALPADSPVAWGGTLTALDRSFISTGSGYAALGALITWVNKPDSIAGVVIKIQPTYLSVEIPFLEMWTLDGAVWTKRNRIALSSRVRTGETLVVDFTSTIYAADTVDAIWITLVPSGTETLTWLVLHTYGVCNNDKTTPACPPGTPPEDCDNAECDTDPTTWLATAGCTPTLLPGEVRVEMPQTYQFISLTKRWEHGCPGPTRIRFDFVDLPAGTTVVVDVLDAHGLRFCLPGDVAFSGGVEVLTQTISASGTMYWAVTNNSGYDAYPNGINLNYLPPYDITQYITFRFTRTIDGAVVNMLEPLVFFWYNGIEYAEPC